jgi:spore coat polysaccharide biosynthesis protein SpsF
MTRTEQEEFWAGGFGDAYVDRNQGEARVASNTALFSRVLRAARPIGSVLELGANIGMNMLALRNLLPSASFAAVEINQQAVQALRHIPRVQVHPVSIFELGDVGVHDLVLCKGVMIHIAPEKLPDLYDLMYRTSRRYLCLAEYYSPRPVEISYRGHEGKLFKRDFAGELLDRFAGLRLVDYGFAWHRDPLCPQDDLNWFLLEKTEQT